MQYLKAHSDDLRWTRAAAADSCVSAEIGNFLFFYFSTPHTSATAERVKRSSSEWAFKHKTSGGFEKVSQLSKNPTAHRKS